MIKKLYPGNQETGICYPASTEIQGTFFISFSRVVVFFLSNPRRVCPYAQGLCSDEKQNAQNELLLIPVLCCHRHMEKSVFPRDLSVWMCQERGGDLQYHHRFAGYWRMWGVNSIFSPGITIHTQQKKKLGKDFSSPVSLLRFRSNIKY